MLEELLEYVHAKGGVCPVPGETGDSLNCVIFVSSRMFKKGDAELTEKWRSSDCPLPPSPVFSRSQTARGA